MGAIRLIQKPTNGQITFKVPDEMRDEPIIIEFRPANESSQTKDTTLAEASKAFFEKPLPGQNRFYGRRLQCL